jgi:hypothetical protein
MFPSFLFKNSSFRQQDLFHYADVEERCLLSWTLWKEIISIPGSGIQETDWFSEMLCFERNSRLRRYSASQKVAGSIPNKVNDFFNLPNPSSRTTALGLTQLLTEMSTGRYFCEVKRGRRVRQPNRHLWADCLENDGSSTYHNSIGLHGLLQGYLYIFYFLLKAICIAQNNWNVCMVSIYDITCIGFLGFL